VTTLHDLLSVRDLAAAYRARRPLSPIEVTEYFLERIDRIDSDVRSMVTVTPELAMRHAAAAARRIAQGDPNPMLGVPVVIKDLIDVKGVRTTAGSAVLRDNVATSSSAVWNRLGRAGAVLLGKANTHEFAYGGTTEPTVNPWGSGHLVGGSSGGPAAALAAGLTPLAVGTDTAGSIRIPANLCGVYGLKPTRGAVSASGVIPLAPSLDVVGPMGHHPRDLALAMSAMSARHASADPAASHAAMRRRAKARRVRFGVLADPGGMTPGVAAAFERTAAISSTFGTTTEVDFDEFADTVWTNFTILGVEAVLVHEQWEPHRSMYTPYVRERLEQAALTLAVDHVRATRAALGYRQRVDQLLEHCDALIVPGIPYPAPALGISSVDVGGVVEDRDTSMCRNTAVANLTGHPVLALPVGFEDGLPVGVQLVGRRGGDADLLALGELFADEISVATVASAFAS